MSLYSQNPQYDNESSSSVLLELMYGYQISQAIFVAAKLEIADILNNGAKTTNELAEATGVSLKKIYRLMQLLVSIGVFSVEKNNKFQLNYISKHLLTGTSDSLRSTIIANGDELYRAWGNLLYGMKTGKIAFDYTFNNNIYSYFKQNYEANENFNEFMKETTREWLLPILEAYDFSGVKTLVDVGGSIGVLTTVILKANPNMQAILFDREDVVVGANRVLEVAGVANRCQIVGGNFFDSVPLGGDLYLLSRVLFNWDDAHAITILKNCYQAMTSTDRLMVVDCIFTKDSISPFISMISLNLFVLGGNFMRTEEDFYKLLSSAGFKVTNTIEMKGLFSVIEASRA